MRRISVPLILISLVGLICYANTFQVQFTFDDHYEIKGNPVIKGISKLISSNKDSFSYNINRYVGYLTFALNYEFGGLDVTGFHIVNITIHIMNGILIYFLVVLTCRTPFFVDTGDRQLAGGDGQEAISDQPPSEDRSPFTVHLSSLIALFSALLFVSHPVQTQAVTYIVQRFTSLVTLFYLLSLVLYISGRLEGQKVKTEAKEEKFSSSTLVLYFLSLFSAFLAMKTKEIAFTLPLVVILYDFVFFQSSMRRKLLLFLPIILILMIIPVSIMGTDRSLGDILSDLSERSRVQTDISRADYFLTQLRVITTYVRLLFLPVNQNVDYDYPIARSLFAPSVFLSFLFLISLFGAALYLLYKSHRAKNIVQGGPLSEGHSVKGAEQNLKGPDTLESRQVINPVSPTYSLLLAPCFRLIAFAILWFFITLSVESSVIPIADVIFEHRLYLPSVGAFIAITTSLFVIGWRLREGRERTEKRVIIGLAAIVMVFSVATYARNRVWQDELRLWEDVVKKSPHKARGYNNLGYIYLGKGMTDRAIEQVKIALQLNPRNVYAYNNLGVAYYHKGWLDAAIMQFRIATDLPSSDPERGDSHYNLGLVYAKKGMLAEALADMESALRYTPNNPELYSDMGVVYKGLGVVDKAIDCYWSALKLDPDYAPAHFNLGMIYREKGAEKKAEEHLRRAHELDPGRF